MATGNFLETLLLGNIDSNLYSNLSSNVSAEEIKVWIGRICITKL